MVGSASIHAFLFKHRILFLVLGIGIIQGTIYVFTVPPWQHYDEPAHFEYAWLLANQNSQLESGKGDQALRREIAASMVEHRFFDDLNIRPNLSAINNPIWIGVSQVEDPPLYYATLSPFLSVEIFSDVTLQLYLTRFTSLTYYLVTLTASYGVARKLIPEGNPIRWVLPVLIALSPGFTDLMSAINNDVGAVAFFSLFLLAAIYLIMDGFSIRRVAWVVITALLCWFTKNTVSNAVLLAPLAILLAVYNNSVQKRIAALLPFLGLILLIGVFSWGDAAGWYRFTLQGTPTSAPNSNSPLGERSFQIGQSAAQTAYQLVQVIPPDVSQKLSGKTVTLGTWMWADKPLRSQTPNLRDGLLVSNQPIYLSTEPTFYAFHSTIRASTNRVDIRLAPFPFSDEFDGHVYYDGIVLVDDVRPLDEIPTFGSTTGREGEWGDRPFVNLLTNSSGESTWPWLRPEIEARIQKFIPGNPNPSMIVGFLLDLRRTGWYYRAASENLMRTYWGKFGWGHVPLLGDKPYRVLGIFTVLGLLGGLIAFFKSFNKINKKIIFFLSFACVFVWGQTFLRGANAYAESIFIPPARYAYPVIIPTTLILVVGWLVGTKWLQQRFNLPPISTNLSLIILFLSFDIFALYSIIHFYYLNG